MMDEELLSLPLLDMRRLHDITGGNPEINKLIIDTFVQECGEFLVVMESASDTGTLRRVAHSLKGSSGNIGSHRIHEAARRLESAMQREGAMMEEGLRLLAVLREIYTEFCRQQFVRGG